MPWYVRRASLRDQADLADLCRAAVGPDDYVIRDLEGLILREVVHVALGAKDEVVGMMAYRPCIDGSAWIGQARTHPDYRRLGVARALVESFVGLARASNTPAIRLWSESTNAEAVASFTAVGFREVARFARVVSLPARGPPKARPRAFDEALCRQVSGSSIVAKGRGYVFHDGTFVPASRPVVFVLAAHGLFRAWNGNLLALASPSGNPDKAYAFTPWAGPVGELFEEACRQAAQAGCGSVEAFLPYDRGVIGEARRAGFEPGSWGRAAILCELGVPAANLRRRGRRTYGELAAHRGGRDRSAGGPHEDRWNR